MPAILTLYVSIVATAAYVSWELSRRPRKDDGSVEVAWLFYGFSTVITAVVSVINLSWWCVLGLFLIARVSYLTFHHHAVYQAFMVHGTNWLRASVAMIPVGVTIKLCAPNGYFAATLIVWMMTIPCFHYLRREGVAPINEAYQVLARTSFG